MKSVSIHEQVLDVCVDELVRLRVGGVEDVQNPTVLVGPDQRILPVIKNGIRPY
ncbi:hypothetical protein [Desulfobacula phenolica]|uniref:hypothetical protein n=1 Tax=Desulfobacula phenolica TaxID=90732 RepID=UPI001587BBC7|nr:hypothetical protein [Desulfobacula phenolica]